MKKFVVLIMAICMAFCIEETKAQQVIVTDDPTHTTPESGAMLDVTSTTKGFLPPRITLTSTSDASTIASPSTGLIIFNTATAGTSPTNVIPGYYYNAGTTGTPNWVLLMKTGLVGGNGITILDDGSLQLNGNSTNWADFVVSPSLAKNSGGSVPSWAVFVTPDIFAYQFSATADQSLDFSIQLPHDYKTASTIYPHVHWSPMTAPGTTRVMWKIDYQWMNLGGNFVASGGSTTISAFNITVSGSGTESTPTRSLTALESCITPLGTGISGTGMNISSILMCRLTRVGSNAVEDNFTGLAALLSIDFHYEVDTFGSRTEYIK